MSGPVQALLCKSSGDTLALDGYSGIWGGYSVNKLRAAYSGAAVRVRRSSDDSEQDIGFTGDTLDTSALSSFVGANSAYVVTWYDQGGGGNNLSQSTAANQPRIVNAGTYDTQLVFDGSNDGFVTANNLGTVSGIAMFMRGTLRSTAAIAMILEQSTDYGSNLNCFGMWWDTTSGGQFVVSLNMPSSDHTGLFSGSYPNGNVFGGIIDAAQSTAADRARLHDNGSFVSRSGGSTSAESGHASNVPLYFGARNSGASLPAPLDCEALVIFKSAGWDSTMVSDFSALI